MTQIHNLPRGFCWEAHYKRVLRWYGRLKKIHNGDRYGDDIDFYYDEMLVFFIFCHQFKDWIKKDTTIPPKEVEQLINDNECLQLCADIANGTKHLGVDSQRGPRSGQNSSMRPVVLLDESKLLSNDAFPLIGLRFNLTLEDGRVLEAYNIASMCLQVWAAFLSKKGLITNSIT